MHPGSSRDRDGPAAVCSQFVAHAECRERLPRQATAGSTARSSHRHGQCSYGHLLTGVAQRGPPHRQSAPSSKRRAKTPATQRRKTSSISLLTFSGSSIELSPSYPLCHLLVSHIAIPCGPATGLTALGGFHQQSLGNEQVQPTISCGVIHLQLGAGFPTTQEERLCSVQLL